MENPIFNFLKQGVKAGRNIAYDILGNGCKRLENERSKEFEVGNGNRRKSRVETDIHKTVAVRNSKNPDQMADATSIATVGEANTKNQQNRTAILTDLVGCSFYWASLSEVYTPNISGLLSRFLILVKFRLWEYNYLLSLFHLCPVLVATLIILVYNFLWFLCSLLSVLFVTLGDLSQIRIK